MERTFFPNRGYWTALGVLFAFLCVELIGAIVLSFQTDPVALWGLIAFLALCVLAFGVSGVLNFFHKRLVLREDEMRLHGALSVRALRFADIVEAEWRPLIVNGCYRPYRLCLRTPTKKLTLSLVHFVTTGAEDELINLLRSRLGAGVLHNWETFEALREGRASSWSPPLFSYRKMAQLLAVATGISLVLGIGIGLFVWLQYPDAGMWSWSGWPIFDWCLYSGIVGLLAGILLLSVLRFMEWAQLKMRTIYS